MIGCWKVLICCYSVGCHMPAASAGVLLSWPFMCTSLISSWPSLLALAVSSRNAPLHCLFLLGEEMRCEAPRGVLLLPPCFYSNTRLPCHRQHKEQKMLTKMLCTPVPRAALLLRHVLTCAGMSSQQQQSQWSGGMSEEPTLTAMLPYNSKCIQFRLCSIAALQFVDQCTATHC